MRFFIFLLFLLLPACTSKQEDPVNPSSDPIVKAKSLPGLTQNYVRQLTNTCYAQLRNTVGEVRPYRGVIWAKCKKDRVMPLEQRLYPDKAKEVAEMYDALITDMNAWYEGRTTYELLEKRWIARQRAIGVEKIEGFRDTVDPI